MERQPGFMWCHVGRSEDDPESLLVAIAFSTRADLDRFMSGPHDRLVAETMIAETYRDIRVSVYDVVEPAPSELVALTDGARASPAAAIVDIGQLYRISAVLRRAIEASLFDAVAETDGDVRSIADRLGTDEHRVRRMCAVLASIGLLAYGDRGEIANTRLAEQHLRWESPESLSELVLHDARPALFERWSAPDDVRQVPAATPVERFAGAMTAIARAGQAGALVDTLDRVGVSLDGKRMLDVGGGLGDYARALGARWPAVEVTVVDLPEVVDLAHARGFHDPPRIGFVACDYRSGLPAGPFDVVLLSNILRGETHSDLVELLARVREVTTVRGDVIVHDLLAVDELGSTPRSAALFGLHLPDAANPSVEEMTGLLSSAGFGDPIVAMIDGYVSSNVVIIARR